MLLKSNTIKQSSQGIRNNKYSLQKLQRNTQNQLKKNKQKKEQILKLFKQEQSFKFNLNVLNQSKLMANNEVFAYLVKSLNKQRHGMFYNMSEKCGSGAPSKLQNKIKQFLFNSLQEATLIPQSQLKKTKYLQRLFVWFTNVFKDNQIQLGFKKQKINKQNQDSKNFDEDWLVRKTFKSNMPLQLNAYQRKMITLVPSFQIKVSQLQKIKQQQKFSIQSTPNTHYQKKLYERNSNDLKSNTYQQILPTLTRNSFYSQATKLRQGRQNQQFQQIKSLWQRKKAHFGQQTAKNFYKQKFTHDKLFGKSQVKKSPFKRLQQLKMSSTLGCFNLQQKGQKITNQFEFFHPYLTGNNFNDIKLKKIQKLKGERTNFNKTFGTFQFKTKKIDLLQQKEAIEEQNSNEIDQKKSEVNLSSDSKLIAVNIDGLGLFSNPFDKIVKNKKTK